MKMPKIKGCTERDLMDRTKPYYPFIQSIFRRLSSIGAKGSNFAIGSSSFREFVT
jgi:hypothetical protein